MFDGYVVCEERAEELVKAWEKDQEEKEERQREKREKRVVDNWKRLVKGLVVRKRIQDQYSGRE